MDEQNELPQLPKGWARTTIEEILRALESGGRPKGGAKGITQGVPSIGGEHLLYSGGFDFGKTRYVPEEYYEKMARGKIAAKDVLVVKDGATTGKTSFVSENFPFGKAAVNEHVFILRVFEDFTNPKYLFFWMQSPFGQQCVADNFQGTAQGGITSAFTKNSDFPLAPFAEQHRIVAKIEELFSDLDAGVIALQKTKAQLKRYRQAVLKAAVEGKLTAEWRAAHRGEIEPASALLEQIRAERAKNANGRVRAEHIQPLRNASELGGLPEGWERVTLQELSWDAGYGTSVKCDYGFDGAPVLRIPNIAKGRIDLTDLKCASNSDSAHFDPAESLATGDLLIVRTNGSRDLIGRAAFVSRDFDSPHYFASYLIRFRLMNQGCLPLWINTFWDSTRNRAWIEGVAATTAGQYNVSMTVLNRMPVPLPSLAEQQQIVAEVERRLSVADETEKIVAQSIAQAERLRQSILKRAFAGKLVPQDPSDEPAEKLLERIRERRDLRGLRDLEGLTGRVVSKKQRKQPQ